MGEKNKKESGALVFLYKTVPGRLLLKFLINPRLSNVVGKYMDSPMSRIHINSFIKNNGINLKDYEKKRYTSFNDCFTRKIKATKRPVDMAADAFIAPCDGKLSVYRIDKNSVFSIKNSHYRIKDLIEGSEKAEDYSGGTCLIFRLCVDNYHRYAYVDNGEIIENKPLAGVLHTVRPIAVDRYPVYILNAREYTIINTDHFGQIAQIEVGAMMIGKIKNNEKSGRVAKGQEKGMFLYGGSTIVVLVKDNVKIDKKYFENTKYGMETDVKLGQRLN